MVKPLSPDTSAETQRVLFRLAREMPVWKRLALTCELIQTTRLLVLAGLRRQFPGAGEEELRRRLVARLLPREDVIRAYGFDPDEGF